MNQFKPGVTLKILLAVDDSPNSAAAVNLLSKITWPVGTFIHIVAVVPDRLPSMDPVSETRNALDETLAIYRWRHWAAAKILTTEVSTKLKAHDITIDTEICEGQLTDVITKRSRDLAVDLTIIGDKGLNTPAKLQLNSTIQKSIPGIDHSVLVARPSKPVRPLCTILAVDNSIEAWRAVEFMCALSLPNWARVIVVNVAETEENDGDSVWQPKFSRPEIIDFAEICTARVINRLHDCGAQVQRIIRAGQPADEILSAAKEQNAALIVVGAHGQTNPKSYHIGNVTEKVVKYAPCSVLAVR